MEVQRLEIIKNGSTELYQVDPSSIFTGSGSGKNAKSCVETERWVQADVTTRRPGLQHLGCVVGKVCIHMVWRFQSLVWTWGLDFHMLLLPRRNYRITYTAEVLRAGTSSGHGNPKRVRCLTWCEVQANAGPQHSRSAFFLSYRGSHGSYFYH